MSNSKLPGKARKHHYLPEAYLKGWAGSDGRLVEYSPRHQGIIPRWSAPGGTGYEHDLYAMPALGEKSDAIEKRLMAFIDSRAAPELELMRQTGRISTAGRAPFATFLTALLVRTPASIHALKTMLPKWRLKERPEIQAIYELLVWKPGMPVRMVDVEADSSEEEVQQFIAECLESLLQHERIAAFLSDMNWRILNLPGGAPDLLTSDHPIITTNGLEHKHSHLLLPIGPRTMFIATRTALAAKRLLRQTSLPRLAEQANHLVVQRARRFVYAADRKQEAMITARFGARPIPSIGEKVAATDPWGAGRPAGYSVNDAIADYVAWVGSQVSANETDTAPQ